MVQTKQNHQNNRNGKSKNIKKIFQFKINLSPKNIFLALIIGSILLMMFISSRDVSKIFPNKSLSSLIGDVKKGDVKKIEVIESKLLATYKDDKIYSSTKESQESLYKILSDSGVDPKSVEIEVKDVTGGAVWLNFISNILPIVLMVGFFLFLIRQARGAQDTLFSFGQSRARLFSKDTPKITFKDVAGVDEAKQELSEVVDFLKNPQKYKALGARTPKGVLLVGPSGTGKTLLARALAGEANTPFFSMAGSEFMEMLVGVGASRVRDLFNTAKKNSPAIIFIDEIDAIGRMRSVGVMGGHDEREQTLNQILVEMDGFTQNENVVVVAASVTGDTPILIKQNGELKLLPIGEFIDKYYQSDSQEGEIPVNEVYSLGMEKLNTSYNYGKNLYFGGSAFKKVRSVFRHKVDEIYEIEFLGGKIRATGKHSVFVRSRLGIETRAVSELKKGDILIDLPYKVNRTNKELTEVRAHRFKQNFELTLPFFDKEKENLWQQKYFYAHEQKDKYSQSQLAQVVGVSQGTVSNWQRGIGNPRAISKEYYKHQYPNQIKVTPEFCRFLGYYVAEGYARWEVDFCFSTSESDYIEDLIRIVKDIFGIEPDRIRHQTPGAVNLIYAATPLANFLAKHCGKGAENKHTPSFLFEAPQEYFLEFLKGVWRGDGHEDKNGRGEITSVSKRLILELNWLCRMHGIKSYIRSFTAKEGRVIKDGKPLKGTLAWRLGWGKANNPFNKYDLVKTNPVKRAIIKSVKRLPFSGFVYDLCGVENEAFFGGGSPILLHNTNRGDLLDSALLRPGRFDRRVVLDLPDMEGRKAILKIHINGKPMAADVNWDKVAKRTVGYSGADLENMLNEAAIQAAIKDKKAIDMEDIEEAATKVKLGPEKKRLQSDLDRKMTAYHEAGHAIVTHQLPNMDPVHRISIVSRGMALGFTLIPPQKDRIHETKTHLLEEITSMLGGRAAEELIFNEMTSGAANDIDKATMVAREMVVEFGMSELGPINFGPTVDVMEWGGRYMNEAQISPEMQSKIDRQIKNIIDGCYKQAALILKKCKKKLDLVAEELIKKETLEGDDFEKLMGGNPKPALAAA